MEVAGSEMGKQFCLMVWDFQDGTSKMEVAGAELGNQFYLMAWDIQDGASKMEVAGNEMGKSIFDLELSFLEVLRFWFNLVYSSHVTCLSCLALPCHLSKKIKNHPRRLAHNSHVMCIKKHGTIDT